MHKLPRQPKQKRNSAATTSQPSPRLAWRKLWPWILGAPVLVILCEYLTVSPWGSRHYQALELPVTLASIAALAVAMYLLPTMLWKKHRQRDFRWLLLSLVFLGFALPGFVIGSGIRNRAFHQLAIRSEPLVAAIRKYVIDHEGRVPQSLEALVPDYLPAIPKTGLGAYPEYVYYGEIAGQEYLGNPWALVVSTGSGDTQDRFLYLPLQNYPEKAFGGRLERVRDWAYLHDATPHQHL